MEQRTMQQNQQGEDSQADALEGGGQKGERKRERGPEGRGGVEDNRKEDKKWSGENKKKRRETEKGEEDKD